MKRDYDWGDGTYLHVEYGGSGSGTCKITSDANTHSSVRTKMLRLRSVYDQSQFVDILIEQLGVSVVPSQYFTLDVSMLDVDKLM